MTAPTPEPHNPDAHRPPHSAPGQAHAPGPVSGVPPADGSAANGSPAAGSKGQPAWGVAAPPPQEPFDPARETTEGGLVALGVGVLGVFLGLVWLWLAPRVPLHTDGSAVYLKHPEGEEAVGADGVFTLAALAFGVLTGLAVFLWRRRGGIGVVIGLALGGLLASMLGWGIGDLLGPEGDMVKAAAEAGKNADFSGPLRLQAKGAVFAWPFAALLVHLLLTAVFVEEDDEPQVPEELPREV